MGQAFIALNEKTKNKLISLAKTIRDEDAGKSDEEGWTISVIFAHIAFWDLRTLVLFRRWKRDGIKLSPVDMDVINESLVPLLKAVPFRNAVDIALATVENVCREIEGLPDNLIREIEALGDSRRLNRHEHWQMHIDQIEKILRSSKKA